MEKNEPCCSRRRSRTTDWRRIIIEQLRRGKVLPIISNRLHNDLILGSHEELVRDYTEFFEDHPYPRRSERNIPAISQYYTIMQEGCGAAAVVKPGYLDCVKEVLLRQTREKDTDGLYADLLEEEDAQFYTRDCSSMAATTWAIPVSASRGRILCSFWPALISLST